MSRASTPTLLSLARYARILQLDPLHFNQAESSHLPEGQCRDVRFQHSWQGGSTHRDRASREMIAREIAKAEVDIAKLLGFFPAPVWIEDELLPYPRLYRRDLYGRGYDIRYRYKTVETVWDHVLYGGKRACTQIGEATYTLVDADGDGYSEWAEFTIAGVAATLQPCEVHAYFQVFDAADAANSRPDPTSFGADPAWEVRPIYARVHGTTLTVRVRAWELIRPDLQERHDAEVLRADDADNYVDSLLFYRVYNDPSDQVEFRWGEDVACSAAACAVHTQTGCLRISDPRRGLVMPQPATWNATTGAYGSQTWAQNVEPDAVLIHYRAGLMPDVIAADCDLLDGYWAETIAMLASTRCVLPICGCDPARQRVDNWREDLSLVTDVRSYNVDPADLRNPLGQRLGEVLTWQRIAGCKQRVGQVVYA